MRHLPAEQLSWFVGLSVVSGCLLASAFPPINLNDAVWIELVTFAGVVVANQSAAPLFAADRG
jgi:hypothetical protein